MAHLGNTVVNGALRVLGGEYVDTINGVAVGSSPKFTDTTYTFATGDSNGQIKVTPSGGTAQNVAVKGLGSAAYTNSGTYVYHRGNASSSNMNGVGRLPASIGMTNLADPGNNYDNPMNGTTKVTGWHLYYDASYSETPSGSNAWVSQIVNRAGTHEWWVRSRNGGTITDGTEWTAGWRHLVVSPQAGQGGTTTPIYVDANGHTQNCSYTIAKSVPSDAVFTDHTYTAATAAPGKVASASAQGSSTNYARQDHTHGIDLATGDSNGQVKIAGTNVSVKGLGSAAYTNTSNYATQTALTNQNLNSLTVAGFYNAGGGNTVTNKPSGVDAFGLEVVHTAGGTYYVQMLYKNGEVIPYRRYCNNGTWSSWAKDESVVYTSSVNAVVGDTTCTISDSSIATTSLIEPFSSNSTGDTIAIKNIAVTAGQAVLTFKALTVDTSFKLRVTNV